MPLKLPEVTMGLFDRLRSTDDEPRVVFIGIDGVPYSLIEEHPDVFPNLHEIGATGTTTDISSIVPPESSACWPSLTTGTNPGKTGVFGFQDRKPDTYETYIPMGAHVHGERAWDTVTAAGRSATVLNVPVTYPPSTEIQRMVSGFLSPSIEEAASSDEVRRTLDRFAYQVDADASLGHDSDKSGFVEDAQATLAARHRTFCHYLDADDWDLFVGVFMTPDRVNHFLFGDYATDGPYADDFLDFYRTLDQYIGEIHDRLDDRTTLIVASDHGFTHLQHEVNCNRYLEETGWLSYRDEDHEDLTDIAPDAEAYGLIPGRFYLNLEGREPSGSVPPEEYEDRLNDLIDELARLTGPQGRSVADRIVRGDEVFHGPHTDIAPDLVMLPTDGFDLKAGFGGSVEVFEDGPRSGMHTFDNATLISDVDLESDDVDLYDITPTILDLLEIEADTNQYDGRSLVPT